MNRAIRSHKKYNRNVELDLAILEIELEEIEANFESKLRSVVDGLDEDEVQVILSLHCDELVVTSDPAPIVNTPVPPLLQSAEDEVEEAVKELEELDRPNQSI